MSAAGDTLCSNFSETMRGHEKRETSREANDGLARMSQEEEDEDEADD